jgi:hypothetical protein
MTQLEAINEMLAACQEAPVNSLDGALPSAASKAIACLNRVSRQVQTKGWTFNTERNRILAKNNDGEVVLPDGTLKVEIDYTHSPGLVRGSPVMLNGKVYDQYNQTYQWPGNLVAFRIVLQRTWAEMPPLGQQYITRRACRIFQDETYGAAELKQTASMEEIEALKQLRRAHSCEARPNMFRNGSTWRIIGGGRGTDQW